MSNSPADEPILPSQTVSSADQPNATSTEQSSYKLLRTEMIAEEDGSLDKQFLNDLSAAQRFKSYLVSMGAKVPLDVSNGLADLGFVFASDLRSYEETIRFEDWNRRLPRRLLDWWPFRRVCKDGKPKS